jgi:hypothetical protein
VSILFVREKFFSDMIILNNDFTNVNEETIKQNKKKDRAGRETGASASLPNYL